MTKAEAHATVVSLIRAIEQEAIEDDPSLRDQPHCNWPVHFTEPIRHLRTLCATFSHNVTLEALERAKPLPLRRY